MTNYSHNLATSKIAAMSEGRMTAGLLLLCLTGLAMAQDDVREPPEIKEPAAFQELIKQRDMSVEMRCNASGNPQPFYEWYYDNSPSPLQSSDVIKIDPEQGTLIIESIDKKHEGFYQCYAKNTFSNGQQAVAMSHKFLLTVARIDEYPAKLDRTLTVVEGDHAKLTCDDKPMHKGPTTFKWYLIRAQSQESPVLMDDGRLFIDSEGSLHFNYVKRTDQEPDAKYACGLSNPNAGLIRLGNKIGLTVTQVPSIPDTRPLLKYSSLQSGLLKFKINKDGQLECVFSGYHSRKPIPDIEWYDADKLIVTGGNFIISSNGRVLQVKNLQESDEKNYRCVATNPLGKYEGNMNLNVTSEPIWVTPLMHQVVTQDQDASLDCVARSASGESPPERPRWFRNGQRLDLVYDPNKYSFSDEFKKLTIKSVQKNADIACYQCYVSNSEGEIFSDACVNVILPIHLVTKPDGHQVIKEGSQINLTVVATGDKLYPLSYRWIINGTAYDGETHPDFITYDRDTRLAYINTTGMSEEELKKVAVEYIREIYNAQQKERVKVVVDLEEPEPPVIIPVTEAGFDFWIIGLIIGLLIIIIVILIIICVICKRKMLEGTYPVDDKEHKAGLDPEKELMDSGFHDLSRADYDDFPEKKLAPNMVDFDGFPDDDNESFGSAEYDGETTAFNEDGSFIGIYSKDKDKDKKPPPYKATAPESNV